MERLPIYFSSGTPHSRHLLRALRRLPWKVGCAFVPVVLLMAAQQAQPPAQTGQAGPGNPAAPNVGQNSAVQNSQRKREISEDSARLLQLATDLKAEVDKTDKDTLSINVIRKAEEIEKLAHSVKERMKVAAVAR